MLYGKAENAPDMGQTVPREIGLWARIPALHGEYVPVTCDGVYEYD